MLRIRCWSSGRIRGRPDWHFVRQKNWKPLRCRDYFADQFSLGDISFIPPLANLERAGYSIADGFPNLKAWWSRMKARPSFDRSWPD